ncbi:MAG: hypothetical protein U0Q18_25530 [Bryobacteraceae bacterium]
MKIPQLGDEVVLARDRFGTKVLATGAQFGSVDLRTDGNVSLDKALAEKLGRWLLQFARRSAE